MHWDLETLYDAHAHRLYAHCWSLLGDHGAADALRATLTEAVRQPPRGEAVLWLHQMARTVCAERGAFEGGPVFAEAATDPMLNVAGNLPGGHREALLLFEGKWLEIRDVASVLGIPPDSVRELLREARTVLERYVLDTLIRGGADPAEHMDVIAAFEKGRLPHLLALRGPTRAPAPLRDRVLAAEHDEIGRPSDAAVGQLVVIDSAAEAPAPDRERTRRRRTALKGVGGVTGVAATVAAGLMMTWPSAGGDTAAALGPHEGSTRPGPVPAGSATDGPGASQGPGAGRQNAAPKPSPTTDERAPATDEPALSGGGANTPTAPEEPLRRQSPATPSSPTPPTSRQKPPPQQSPSQESPSQESPDREPDGRWRPNNPLDPITDIVGGITSPLLGD